MASPSKHDPFDAAAIRRPVRALQTYYLIVSLLSGPAFPFVGIPLWIKYHTLRYRIDDEGVTMAWGYLFRKEILLTYRRIQDIHVRRNVIHRWLGLASVAVQTASGTAGAEMTIVGILEPDRLRDYLYLKMRGARHVTQPRTEEEADEEALDLLRQIRDLLRDREGGRGHGT
ncbi:MAG: PH domain-containing protein [bacterium]|nr:PH domain-containing protein [bacterium]